MILQNVEQIKNQIPESCYHDTSPDASTLNRVIRNINPDSVSACLGEELDNSVSAGAKNITINCDGETLIYHDDGHSIQTPEELKDCLTMKQNRNGGTNNIFGWGWNNALTNLSEHAYILCRPSDGVFVIGVFDTTSTEHTTPTFFISEVKRETQEYFANMWNTYAPNGVTTGTLQVMEGLNFKEEELFDYMLSETIKKTVGSIYYGVHKSTGLNIVYNGKPVKFEDPLHMDLPGTRTLLEDEFDFPLEGGNTTKVGIRLVRYPKKGIKNRHTFPRFNIAFDGRIHGTDVLRELFAGKPQHLFPKLGGIIDLCAKELVDTGEAPVTPNKVVTQEHSLGKKLKNFLLQDCGLEELIEEFLKENASEPVDDEEITKDCNRILKKFRKPDMPSRDTNTEERKAKGQSGSNNNKGNGKSKPRDKKNTRKTRSSTSHYTMEWSHDEDEGIPPAVFQSSGRRIHLICYSKHPTWLGVVHNNDRVLQKTLGVKKEEAFILNMTHLISTIEGGLAEQKPESEIQNELQVRGDLSSKLLTKIRRSNVH